MPRVPAPVEHAAHSVMPIFLLVAIAGGVDALMVLHSKELLAVYMTGNSTKLSKSLLQGNWMQAASLFAVIACFLSATTAAAWLGSKAPRWRAAVVLSVTALLLIAAVPFTGNQYSLPALLIIAAAMGAINQARADQPGVTFITGILVRVGRQLADGNLSDAGTGLLRWLSLPVGAAVVIVLDERLGDMTLLAVGGFTLVCALGTLFYDSAHHADKTPRTSHS